MKSPRAAAVLLAAACGCTQQFDPCFGSPQKIRDLRVLAVRSEPPEALVDFDAGDVQAVDVSVLAVLPAADAMQDLLLEAMLCAPADDRICPNGSPLVARRTGKAGVFSFTVAARVADVIAARNSDPLRGYGGVRLQLDVHVVGAISGETRASKLLLYSPRDGHVPNHGLSIPSLEVWHGGEVATAQFVKKNHLQMQVGDRVSIQPVLAPGPGGFQAAEEYDTVDLLGRPVHLREHISFQFFTDLHGKFSAETAPAPEPSEPDAPVVDFTPTYEAGGSLYVVARDGRGGVAFSKLEWSALDDRLSRPSLETDCQ